MIWLSENLPNSGFCRSACVAIVSITVATLLQESSMSVCTDDSCISQVSQCMTPAGVKYLNARLLQESRMLICMPLAGVKYLQV